MRPKPVSPHTAGEKMIKDIRRAARRHYSAEDKIRILLEGLRGDDSIAELCRREGIAQSQYYVWSKEFMEAGIARRTFSRWYDKYLTDGPEACQQAFKIDRVWASKVDPLFL